MTSSRDFPEPIFVGGSPRAGTHAMGRLVSADPRYHLIPIESRLHSGGGGLPDLLAGRTDLHGFLDRCRGHWWARKGLQRRGRGLRKIIERGDLEAALDDFERGFESDPWQASRRLVRALLDPVAERHGKPAWVDVTGGNIAGAPTLHRLFPHARFVNMVRDGRAVAAAMLRKQSMTDDGLKALSTWEKRVREAHAAMGALPPEAVLVVHLDDLVALDRERTFRRLVEFLHVDEDAPMRRYFDAHISADAAHFGRWRERLPPPEARRIDRRYRRLVRDLRREGIAWAPAPRDGGVRQRLRAASGPVRRSSPRRTVGG